MSKKYKRRKQAQRKYHQSQSEQPSLYYDYMAMEDNESKVTPFAYAIAIPVLLSSAAILLFFLKWLLRH